MKGRSVSGEIVRGIGRVSLDRSVVPLEGSFPKGEVKTSVGGEARPPLSGGVGPLGVGEVALRGGGVSPLPPPCVPKQIAADFTRGFKN